MKYVGFLIAMMMSVSVQANEPSVCSKYSPKTSTADQRQALLVETQKGLLAKSVEAIRSMEHAKIFLESCSESFCRDIRHQFIESLAEQMRISKILTVLSKSDILYYEPILKVEHALKRNELDADSIANFSIKGFTFTQKEKDIAFELWKTTFIPLLQKSTEPKEQPSGFLQHQINEVFELASLQLVNMNPLLPFVDESALTDNKALFAGFDRLIAFNKEFQNIIGGYKTHHKTGFWSYVNLTVADHEMGLVNFPHQIEETIGKAPEQKRQMFCNAWNDLEIQQRRRMRTSIGVGFTAAVVCGVGVWSGVGTVPAAILCSFAVADGLWGANVGRKDSLTGYYSRFAGKVLDIENAKYSEGVQNYLDARHLQATGRAVFIINMIGLVPIARSVIKVTKGAHGTLKSLLIVPSADIASSTTEGATSRLVYVLLALRGLELKTDSLTEIMASLE